MLSFLLATSFLAAHPGRLLDTREYTVVVPNLMGNGVSYSPSRDVPYLPPSPELPYVPPWYVPNLRPPTLLSIADNVAAQHALLQVSPNPNPNPNPKPNPKPNPNPNPNPNPKPNQVGASWPQARSGHSFTAVPAMPP